MPDSECKERIAVLEEQQRELKSDFIAHSVREEDYLKRHSELLDEIRREQAKMKGFWGGLTFGLSAVVTVVSLVLTNIFGEVK